MIRARNHRAVSDPLDVYDTRPGADYSLDRISQFFDRGVPEGMQHLERRAALASLAGH